MSAICITGAMGFIGRHAALHLSRRGHQVVGVGHGARIFDSVDADGLSYWVNGEIESANLSAIADSVSSIDAIVHLAGGSSVGSSLAHPFEDFQRTVTATARVLEWIRVQSPQTRFVAISSAAVYGNGKFGPIAETSTLRPSSPYGVHKSILEQLIRMYSNQFSLNASIARLFSVYGNGLTKQLLWDICSKCDRNEKTIELSGTGAELRDWLHVSDACRLIDLLVTAANPSCPMVNGGTGQGLSIRAVAENISSHWPGARSVSFSGVGRRGDPSSLIADTGLATELGFKPEKPAFVGFDEYVHWFRARKSTT